MSDRYAILGQKSLAAAASGDLYEVPVAAEKTAGSVDVSPKAASSLTQALVTSIVVCNTDATNGAFTISVVKFDPTTTTVLFKGTTLSSGDTHVLTLNLTLSPGDKITVAAATSVQDFTAFGVEMITGVGPRG
tara:strand:- start:142 stop:540 length:399 start_codon:yes stop_codon:yes gene_type:complete